MDTGLFISNVMTRDALIKCDFSGGVMYGVERAEEFMQNAYLLKNMRNDYELFRGQLSSLGNEKQIFEQYLRGKKSLNDIALEQGISYESAQQKMHKLRCSIKKRVVGYMNGELEGIA